MNRDDIIRFGEQADEVADRKIRMRGEYHPDWHQVRDEAFAALVISHHVQETRVKPTASEREMLQQIAYQHGGIGDLSQTEFEFGALVAAHEREAAAKECETLLPSNRIFDQRYYEAVEDCVATIRARGEK